MAHPSARTMSLCGCPSRGILWTGLVFRDSWRTLDYVHHFPSGDQSRNQKQHKLDQEQNWAESGRSGAYYCQREIPAFLGVRWANWMTDLSQSPRDIYQYSSWFSLGNGLASLQRWTYIYIRGRELANHPHWMEDISSNGWSITGMMYSHIILWSRRWVWMQGAYQCHLGLSIAS